jgi:hypothetical protein
MDNRINTGGHTPAPMLAQPKDISIVHTETA